MAIYLGEKVARIYIYCLDNNTATTVLQLNCSRNSLLRIQFKDSKSSRIYYLLIIYFVYIPDTPPFNFKSYVSTLGLGLATSRFRVGLVLEFSFLNKVLEI